MADEADRDPAERVTRSTASPDSSPTIVAALLAEGEAPEWDVPFDADDEGDPFDDRASSAALADWLGSMIDAADALGADTRLELPPSIEHLRLAIEQLAKLRSGTLTVGDLIPSEEELDEDPELGAWFAGVGPAPESSFGAPARGWKLAALPTRHVPVARRARGQARSREHRARPARRARSPGRNDDDPHEPAPALAGFGSCGSPAGGGS
jgi:hypothetical protein